MKAEEVRKMSEAELKVAEEKTRRELYDLRSISVTQQLDNPHDMKRMRADVARIQTERRAREIASQKGNA